MSASATSSSTTKATASEGENGTKLQSEPAKSSNVLEEDDEFEDFPVEGWELLSAERQ